MAKIPFTVSARTARLIGRENVANAEGAIIELVKNTYDADASICILLFDTIYKAVPKIISKEEYNFLNTKNHIIGKYYKERNNTYTLISEIDNNSKHELSFIFKQYKQLIIIDNGDGMTDEIIQEHWMTIGTDYKQQDIFTKNGRIRSGSKGIGRFALDRLGSKSHMLTKPKNKNILFDWNVNWDDFETTGAKINEITADLNSQKNTSYSQSLINIINNKNTIDLINKNKFENGTTLIIKFLRDNWSEKEIINLFSSLEILTPPNNEQRFQIYLFQLSISYFLYRKMPNLF
jgi:hypothetical protein